MKVERSCDNMHAIVLAPSVLWRGLIEEVKNLFFLPHVI